MTDPSPILPYRPPMKPRARVESADSALTLFIQPAPRWKKIAACLFAAILSIRIALQVIGALSHRWNPNALGLASAFWIFVVFTLWLIIRRRRVPTLISIADGFLIVVTPDLPKLHHEFEIGSRLTLCAVLTGDSLFSGQVGYLEIRQSQKSLFIFAQGRAITELREIESAVGKVIEDEVRKISQSALPTAVADPHPL